MKKNKAPKIKIPVPSWAAPLLKELVELETKQGHIPSMASEGWRSQLISQLVKGQPSEGFTMDVFYEDESQADHIFERLVRGLTLDGRSPEEIASLINAHIGYDNGPPYCGVDDIRAILEDQPL